MICTAFLIFGTISYSQLRLSLQAGIEAPTGDFGLIATTGYGFTATLEFVQNSPLSFTGSIAYNRWGAKGDLPEGYDFSFTAVPVLVGFRYYLSQGDFHPYLGAELGIVFTSSDQTRLDEGFRKVTYTTSENNFGFAPLGGFRYHLSSSVDLDMNIKYNIITTTGSSTDYLGINAGIQFSL